MFRTALVASAVAALALVGNSAAGKVAFINYTTSQKAVQADAVVVGKVSEIEAEDAEVLPHPGAADKVKLKVGVIKIADGLVGAKNVTHVKVLFAPGQPSNPDLVGRRPIRGGLNPVSLAEGQDGLFFLTKHPTAASYYVINQGFDPILAKAENYKDELASVKASLATLADPMKALKAEKADDRLAAAALLIQKYRRGLPVPAKEEAIPAEETKAILAALADADWTAAEKPQPGGARIDYQAQPANLASMLGLHPGANGFPTFTPKPGESYGAKYQEVFKAWLAKSGDKFEIKRFVATGK